MILGLDISTSAIGACILSDEEVVFIDFLSFKNEKNIFNKASLFREFLLSIKKRFSISLVVIEENLQAFRPGLSSAKTIVTLARFNGMCSLISSEVFQFFPKFFLHFILAIALLRLEVKIKSFFEHYKQHCKERKYE